MFIGRKELNMILIIAKTHKVLSVDNTQQQITVEDSERIKWLSGGMVAQFS